MQAVGINLDRQCLGHTVKTWKGSRPKVEPVRTGRYVDERFSCGLHRLGNRRKSDQRRCYYPSCYKYSFHHFVPPPEAKFSQQSLCPCCTLRAAAHRVNPLNPETPVPGLDLATSSPLTPTVRTLLTARYSLAHLPPFRQKNQKIEVLCRWNTGILFIILTVTLLTCGQHQNPALPGQSLAARKKGATLNYLTHFANYPSLPLIIF
jgi:hypothetical protein